MPVRQSCISSLWQIRRKQQPSRVTCSTWSWKTVPSTMATIHKQHKHTIHFDQAGSNHMPCTSLHQFWGCCGRILHLQNLVTDLGKLELAHVTLNLQESHLTRTPIHFHHSPFYTLECWQGTVSVACPSESSLALKSIKVSESRFTIVFKAVHLWTH